MNTFILIGSIEQGKRHLKRFIIENEYSPYNTHFFEDKIGVDIARQIRQLALTAPTSGEKRIIALFGIMSDEAQNALLKAIEELRDDTTLFVVTDSSELILPTVMSRCQLLQLEAEEVSLSLFPLHTSLNQHTTTFSFVQSVIDKGELNDRETIEILEHSFAHLFKTETDTRVLRKAAIFLCKLYEYKQLILENNVQLRIGLEKILASNIH